MCLTCGRQDFRKLITEICRVVYVRRSRDETEPFMNLNNLTYLCRQSVMNMISVLLCRGRVLNKLLLIIKCSKMPLITPWSDHICLLGVYRNQDCSLVTCFVHLRSVILVRGKTNMQCCFNSATTVEITTTIEITI